MKTVQNIQSLTLTVFVILVIFQQIDIEKLQEKTKANQVQIDDLVMHSKTPCMTLPDNTPCWDKTVFKTLPGGYQQKELRRICAYTSPKAQVWK